MNETITVTDIRRTPGVVFDKVMQGNRLTVTLGGLPVAIIAPPDGRANASVSSTYLVTHLGSVIPASAPVAITSYSRVIAEVLPYEEN